MIKKEEHYFIKSTEKGDYFVYQNRVYRADVGYLTAQTGTTTSCISIAIFARLFYRNLKQHDVIKHAGRKEITNDDIADLLKVREDFVVNYKKVVLNFMAYWDNKPYSIVIENEYCLWLIKGVSPTEVFVDYSIPEFNYMYGCYTISQEGVIAKGIRKRIYTKRKGVKKIKRDVKGYYVDLQPGLKYRFTNDVVNSFQTIKSN